MQEERRRQIEEQKRIQEEKWKREDEEKARQLEEERKIEEARKKKLQEEKEKEQREYDKVKSLITVDDEGFDVAEQGSAADLASRNIVTRLIEFIQQKRKVSMEEIASEFNITAPDAVERVLSLNKSGQLTGVMDDRGRFIYFKPSELQAVADYVIQRGRVSIAELTDFANRLLSESFAQEKAERERKAQQEQGDEE